ncbi:UvrD-helicase domain-containing protein [Acinetobacter indicus]|uniref:UvrD-helicase domain-containing protein n=1 Tax=Acinetobacter TaxID=469 RepID=UPI0015D226F1|nr:MULTISPECIES: UvrD-helicase domain-containing protein [Acinetobacter]MCP0918080.1 UvrD-helicase domain-containing protein [Acinetobacter indicus]
MQKQATEEQSRVVERFRSGESFKVLAFAGTGKTTTLKMISDTSSSRKGLYLAFNKRLADEAKTKFPKNVQCATFHSFAFRNSPRWLTDKLKRPRVLPSHVSDKLGLKQIELTNGSEKFSMTANQQSSLILKAVNDYCDYSGTNITYKNVLGVMPQHIPENLHADIADYLTKYVHQLWCEFLSQNGTFAINHNIYFKEWCLSKPKLNFDYLLIDEAQDLSATQFKTIIEQDHCQAVYVGDSHQQIYEWRNAINSMQNLPLKSEHLTQSFRFGESIAAVSNIILNGALNEMRPIRGNKLIDSKVYNDKNIQKSNGILCRTNAVAFAKFVELSANNIPAKIAFETNTILKFTQDAKKLKANIPVDSGDLMGFQSWFHLIEYIEQSGDANLKTMVKIIDEYGPEQIESLINKSANIQSNILITTAHKAKGLEFDRVSIEDDFQYKIIGNELQMAREEARLIYVALTRAQRFLHLQGVYDLIQAIKNPNITIKFK